MNKHLKHGLLSDPVRVSKAILTNQIARFSSKLYVRMTGETGRGQSVDSAQETADYFHRCVEDYFDVLGFSREQADEFLSGRHILEYGPGDIPGVALLLIARGAERVTCVDRFPLLKFSSYNQRVLRCLLDGLAEAQRARAARCFIGGDPEFGLNAGPLRYVVDRNGLSGMRAEVSCIISRAVLEHVHDVDEIFMDMSRALQPDGIALHQVDLKSHGLHLHNPLDFLTWPSRLWQWMYSKKGVPNRLRVNAYTEAAEAAGFKVELLKPALRAKPKDIQDVRPYLAAPFRDLRDEELSVLEFWMQCRLPGRTT